MLAQLQFKAVRAITMNMLDGAESKKNRLHETMVSSGSLLAQVILLSLYDCFVVSGSNRFWYVKVDCLSRGSARTRIESVSPCGRLSFLFSFDMSKLVSSIEATLKQCSGRFPLEGDSIFDILLTVCLM